MMKKIKSIVYFMRLPILLIVIVSISTYLILIANGYKIYRQAKKIQKTGMIYIKCDPKEVEIYLNTKSVGMKCPVKISELTKGRYDVVISKTNYTSWEKSYNIEEGIVSTDENVILFYSEPQLENVSSDEKTAIDSLLVKQVNNNIEIKNEIEIWLINNDNSRSLITRLSSPIKNVAYYSDKKHIVYQIRNEIRIIDIKGTNDSKIANLPNENKVNLYVEETGQFLYIISENETIKYKIH